MENGERIRGRNSFEKYAVGLVVGSSGKKANKYLFSFYLIYGHLHNRVKFKFLSNVWWHLVLKLLLITVAFTTVCCLVFGMGVRVCCVCAVRAVFTFQWD